MKICKNCDLLFEDTVGFCTKCGKKLENFQNDIHDINIDTELNTFSDNSSSAESHSSSNNIFVIALIVSALLIGGMGGYILFGRSSNNNDSVTIPATDSTQQAQQTTKPHEADSAQNPKEPIQQPTMSQNGPKDAFLGFHKAITDKRFEDAYNILSPEYQKYVKDYDNFASGYTTTLISDIVELVTLYEDDNSASYSYKLKAVDREGSGTKTQYFAGKAKLIKMDGSWRLDSTEAKRISNQNDVEARQSRYSAKTETGYPFFLNSDPNCILVAGHMGGAWYLVKNSIKCTALSGSERIITADVVSVSNADKGNTVVNSRKTYKYYFNENSGYAKVGDQPINYDGPMYITRVANPTGAMSYYIATGKKWTRFTYYGNSFYSRADL